MCSVQNLWTNSVEHGDSSSTTTTVYAVQCRNDGINWTTSLHSHERKRNNDIWWSMAMFWMRTAPRMHCVCHYHRNCFRFYFAMRCETLRVFNFYTVDSHHCFSVFFAVPLLNAVLSHSFCFVFNSTVLSSFVGSFVALFPTDIFLPYFCYPVVVILFSSLHFGWLGRWTYIAAVAVKTKLFRTAFSPRKIPFVWW